MLTFIDTNKLPRVKTPQGEVTEILNRQLCGAKNVLRRCAGSIPERNSRPNASNKHQLIYLMEGTGEHPPRRQGLRRARRARACIWALGNRDDSAGRGASLKLFHLVVPQIPG